MLESYQVDTAVVAGQLTAASTGEPVVCKMVFEPIGLWSVSSDGTWVASKRVVAQTDENGFFKVELLPTNTDKNNPWYYLAFAPKHSWRVRVPSVGQFQLMNLIEPCNKEEQGYLES